MADLRHLWATPAGRPLVLAAAALLVATVVGLIALWPGDRPDGPSEAFGGPSLAATVTASRELNCPGPDEQRCTQISVRIGDGAEAIVTTLVGSIALLVSVPLTTGLAAVLVARVPGDALGSGAHEHTH